MTALAPTLQAFFCDRLIKQRAASPNTIAAYRDTFRLLIAYTTTTPTPTHPILISVSLTPPSSEGFSTTSKPKGTTALHPQHPPAAIRSFYKYAPTAHRTRRDDPARLTIPQKRTDRATVSFLTRPETEALLAAPDTDTWCGRRHTILTVMTQTGLRVTETTALTIADVQLDRPGAHINIAHGKGRKQRAVPISTAVIAVLGEWLRERNGQPDDPLFPSGRRTHSAETPLPTSSPNTPQQPPPGIHP
jgi:site-specific recombinase XerD